ncbi:MAG TPA: UDP-3-O-(3-hydroxymyristoyl)glucosamine N-acyltransferase [Alphaproteobacteria bacterium]
MTAAAAPARSLNDIATALGAQLVGDGSALVRGVAHPAMAENAETLALAVEEGAEKALARTKAATAAVAEGRAAALAGLKGGIVVKRPRLALAQLLEIFDRPPVLGTGVHPSAVIDPTATIGPGASIGPLCSIGPRARIGAGTRLLAQVAIGADAVLGEGCLVHAGARIGDRCALGKRVIVQPNAVIGADGFSFVTPERGSVESAKETGRIEAQNLAIVRINSIGNVEIGDEAEIGAGTTIARGTLGPTRIGRGTKIDNLVQVGHNCTIGANCLIAGNCGISGSVVLGDRVTLAGGCGIADHVTIGEDTILIAGSGVWQSIPPRQIWGGYPAQPWKESQSFYLHVKRLPRMLRDIMGLRGRVAEIEKKLQAGRDARPGGRQ